MLLPEDVRERKGVGVGRDPNNVCEPGHERADSLDVDHVSPRLRGANHDQRMRSAFIGDDVVEAPRAFDRQRGDPQSGNIRGRVTLGQQALDQSRAARLHRAPDSRADFARLEDERDPHLSVFARVLDTHFGGPLAARDLPITVSQANGVETGPLSRLGPRLDLAAIAQPEASRLGEHLA